MTFYGVCLCISIAIYVWFYIADMKRSLCQHLMIIAMIVCNAGMFAVSVSPPTGHAILANVIVCLGACFEPLLFSFTMCEVCRIDISRRRKIFLVFVQTGIFVLCLIFGEDVANIDNALCLIAVLIMGSYSERKNLIDRRQFFNVWANAILALVIIAVVRIVNPSVDARPLVYIVFVLGMMNAVSFSNLYMVYENTDILKKQMDRVGFLVFDKGVRFVGCNDFALSVFDELKGIRLGGRIPECENVRKNVAAKDVTAKDVAAKDVTGVGTGDETTVCDALYEIVSDVEKFASYPKEQRERIKNSKYLTVKVQKNVYDCEIHPIFNYRGSCRGYYVEFKDETEYNLMQEITDKYNEKLERDVEAQVSKIKMMQEKTILGIAMLVESRDLSTGGHIRRTSDVVRIFSEKLRESDMGFTDHFLDMVIRSAPMHDIGKIGVEDAILQKQDKFTDEEYARMKLHAENGGRMLREFLTGLEDDDFLTVLSNVANYHHEKVDGTGYPEGLKGDEIPIEARIMALADVFDALVSRRCYKDAFSFDRAFEIIEEDAGSHFDKKLAGLFIACRPRLEQYYITHGD